MKLGYVRVSSKDQNEERQIKALKEQGVEKFYIDKQSGKDTNRPQLIEMLNYMRDGDVVYFESISRLARDTKDFLELMEKFSDKSVSIVCLKEPIDTTTPQGKMISTIFASMYEMERENIRQRQAEGIAIAKEKGVHLGRPKAVYPKNWVEVYSKWKDDKISGVEAMNQLGLKKTTFYKLVKEYSGE